MANVEWSFVDRESPSPIRGGDLVSAEAGGLPIYEVVEVDGGRVWLREALSNRDCVMPTDAMCWRIERPLRRDRA